MKILVIASICPIPGVQKENDVILRLYDKLKESNPEVEVRVLRPALYSSSLMARLKTSWKRYYGICKVDRFEILGFQTLVVPYLFLTQMSLIFQVLSYLIWPMNKRRILEFLEGFDFDVIHAHYINIDGSLARAISRYSGRPYIVSTQREESRFRNWIERAGSQRVLHDASAVTSLSPFAAKKIKQHFEIESRVIPFGIDDCFFEQVPCKKTPAKMHFVTVCRLLKLKNIDLVLRSLAGLANKYDFHFTVIGDGPERGNLERIVKSLSLENRVTFEGIQDQQTIRKRFLTQDVFVMPSAPETYGLVYAEAMACGLPIVCAEDNGFDGHFVVGREGYCVKPHDLQDLQKVLRQFLENPNLASQMSENARSHAQHFTWSHSCDTYLGVLRQVLDNTKSQTC